MNNELSRKFNFQNSQDSILTPHIGLPHQDERLYHSECLGNHRTHRVHYHWPLDGIAVLASASRMAKM